MQLWRSGLVGVAALKRSQTEPSINFPLCARRSSLCGVDGFLLICDERDRIFAALLDAAMIVTYFMSR
jgi:hypothetical protein